MNLEKYYKWSSLVAMLVASFLLGATVYNDLPIYWSLIILMTPTAVLLTVVCLVLLWSYYIVRKNP